jgi:hypothetical protein
VIDLFEREKKNATSAPQAQPTLSAKSPSIYGFEGSDYQWNYFAAAFACF